MTTDLPLARAAATTPTVLWNDSADPDELRQSIAFGAVGATCNPVIALAAITKHPDVWLPRIREIADEHPTWAESEIGWQAVKELSIEAARLLEPAFAASGGRDGRLSIQTDPRLHRDTAALVEQAVEFSGIADNIIVKIPAIETGIAAIEEAAFRGVSINATLSFSVPQALAVGAALERALDRRAAAGLPDQEFGHVVTIMGGRLDDWLKSWATEQRILTTPGALDWQKRINENGIEAADRIGIPVDPQILGELESLSEFRRAYEPDGMSIAEFETFGASRNTLRQFLEADAQLDALVRDVLVPPA